MTGFLIEFVVFFLHAADWSLNCLHCCLAMLENRRREEIEKDLQYCRYNGPPFRASYDRINKEPLTLCQTSKCFAAGSILARIHPGAPRTTGIHHEGRYLALSPAFRPCWCSVQFSRPKSGLSISPPLSAKQYSPTTSAAKHLDALRRLTGCPVLPYSCSRSHNLSTIPWITDSRAYIFCFEKKGMIAARLLR